MKRLRIKSAFQRFGIFPWITAQMEAWFSNHLFSALAPTLVSISPQLFWFLSTYLCLCHRKQFSIISTSIGIHHRKMVSFGKYPSVIMQLPMEGIYRRIRRHYGEF